MEFILEVPNREGPVDVCFQIILEIEWHVGVKIKTLFKSRLFIKYLGNRNKNI